jgi:hypothetical protein
MMPDTTLQATAALFRFYGSGRSAAPWLRWGAVPGGGASVPRGATNPVPVTVWAVMRRWNSEEEMLILSTDLRVS